MPVALAAIELGVLLFIGPVWWCEVRLPGDSPVLSRLAESKDVGLVGGRLLNIPVSAGLTPAFPSLGITPPPPNYLLEAATCPPGEASETDLHWLRRFGVTHGIWSPEDDIGKTVVLDVIPDPVLDRLMAGMPRLHARTGPGRWCATRCAFPPAWVARRIHEVPGWGQLYTELSVLDMPDDAWFLAEDVRPGCRPRPRAWPMSGAGTAARRSSSTTGRAS